uniref:Uncharacterized protein n=1 Tax=Arundo donax TaxID=35708 RepID=A0A0A9CF73_ARUDO
MASTAGISQFSYFDNLDALSLFKIIIIWMSFVVTCVSNDFKWCDLDCVLLALVSLMTIQ